MIPRSMRNAKTTVLSPATEKKLGNIIAVTINETSIRLNTIKNKELMITPAVHTHFFLIYVPKENAINKPENTIHTIVDSNVPKSIKGYIPVGPVGGQPGIDKTNSIE
jgi:hypothetical protein